MAGGMAMKNHKSGVAVLILVTIVFLVLSLPWVSGG